MSRPCRDGLGWPLALVVALVATASGACFSEPGFQDTSASAGTTDPTDPGCDAGLVGCECYGNGTCDPGLRCAADPVVCIPEDCMPGEPACVCTDAGHCNAPLLCEAGICSTPGSHDDSGNDGDGTSTGPTHTSGADTTDTGAHADDSTSTLPGDGTDTTAGTSDSGEPSCNELRACEACIECADAPGGGCEQAVATCTNITGCMTAAKCLTDCGLTALCFEDCCGGVAPAATEAADLLVNCRTDHCTAPCERLEFPTCG